MLLNDYSEVLFSINLNFGLIFDEFIFYFGVVKVMVYFKVKDLNILVSCILCLDMFFV